MNRARTSLVGLLWLLWAAGCSPSPACQTEVDCPGATCVASQCVPANTGGGNVTGGGSGGGNAGGGGGTEDAGRSDAGAEDAGTEVDAGLPDAGTETDAGGLDGGSSEDAGTPEDAGTSTDAGTPADAGTTPDAGTPADAGTTPDAGTPADAGTTTDAGTTPATIYQLKNGTTPVGTTVRVTSALVTAVSTQGFYLQVKPGEPGDQGANFSGLTVNTSSPAFLYAAVVGRRVDVVGTLQLVGAERVLGVVTEVNSVGNSSEAPPAPVSITPSQVALGGLSSDALTAVLVSVANVGVTKATTGEFTVNNAGGDLVVSTLLFTPAPLPPVGFNYASVRGVLTRQSGLVRLAPRAVSDLLADVSFGPATSFVDVGQTGASTFPLPLTVTLAQPVTADTFVAITSTNAGAVKAVGEGVIMLAGQRSAVVLVDCASQGFATLSASLSGGPALTAKVRALGLGEVPTLVALTPDGATIPPHGTQFFTVTLDLPAPAGGLSITLGAAPSNAATLPVSSVTVPAGQLSADFSVVSTGVTGPMVVSATLGNTTLSAQLTATATAEHLVLNEVDYNQLGTDTKSFIELYNPTEASISLSGLAVVLVDGAYGVEYGRFLLSTAGPTLAAGGYLVIGNSTVTVPTGTLFISATGDFLKNGFPDGVALVDTSSGTLVDALSYAGSITTATLTGVPGTVNLVEGAPFSGIDTSDNLFSLSRAVNGFDTNNASTDWALRAPSPGAANP